MSCPHCTRQIDEDGVPSEYCTGFYNTATFDGVPVKHDIRIEPWVDDDNGKRYWTVCVGVFNVENNVEKAEMVSVAATTIEAPPYCPWCGERL